MRRRESRRPPSCKGWRSWRSAGGGRRPLVRRQPSGVNSRYLLSVLVDESAQGSQSNLGRARPNGGHDDESGAATPATHKELVSLTDTADLYATATGLIERSAAAYALGVPEGAGDDGFFGPASITWRMSADLASPVAISTVAGAEILSAGSQPPWRTSLRSPSATGPRPCKQRPGCGAFTITSAAPTRLPAVRMRRAIPLFCCGCTGRWSTPSWPPEAWSGRRFPPRIAIATSRRW